MFVDQQEIDVGLYQFSLDTFCFKMTYQELFTIFRVQF